MILLISYDLKSPDKDYESLYKAIKNSGSTWWHYLESMWLVKTTNSPKEVFDIIHPSMDKDDSLFITELSDNYYGWLPTKAWEWIRNNKK